MGAGHPNFADATRHHDDLGRSIVDHDGVGSLSVYIGKWTAGESTIGHRALVHVFGLRFGTMFSLAHLRSRVAGALGVCFMAVTGGFRFGDEGQMGNSQFVRGDF